MEQQNDLNHPRQGLGLWQGIFRAMAYGSVIVMLGMTLLTSVDVIARYIFNRPISGAFELTEIGLALVVFLAMPLTTYSKEHVEVDLLSIPSSGTRRFLLRLLAVVCVAGIFGFMAWEVWEHTEKLLKRGTVTNSLSIPLYLIAGVVALACAMSAVAAIIGLFKGDTE
ncbi:TRAP transporter small permease [Epibacterium ulvae]|uniref:TRAP transporter small permease n=1 Tax=Epibacterium ulvae TaxID=1156985 RepID=UPI0024928212|nr:TRAP transporter small permease [Epibacterium ulvae]